MTYIYSRLCNAGFDGEDLIYNIREENLDSIIILVTGQGKSEDNNSFTKILGADDFIFKPLDAKLFMLRIISCLKQYKLNRENLHKSGLALQYGYP